MLFTRTKTELPPPERALAGRDHYPFRVPETHYVNGHRIQPPFPENLEVAIFGLGCFWGAEEIYWQTDGVWATAVGYAGGTTAHPTYEEVCSGRTGHTESVLVVFDPATVTYTELVARFFEVHDPTQGMRQGNDIGTQYRSAIYYTCDDQRETAQASVARFGEYLRAQGFGEVTTEVAPAAEVTPAVAGPGQTTSKVSGSPGGSTDGAPFYYAEDYHQQYLAKNPNGYRCHANTGLCFPRD
jgi:peptide-methionine (S)-S-oxide reductase